MLVFSISRQRLRHSGGDGELDHRPRGRAPCHASRGNNRSRGAEDRVRVAPSARHPARAPGGRHLAVAVNCLRTVALSTPTSGARAMTIADGSGTRKIAACPGRAAITNGLETVGIPPAFERARTTRAAPTGSARSASALASCPASCVCRSLTCRRRSRASVCPRSIAAGNSAGSTDRSRTLAATVSRARDSRPGAHRTETRAGPTLASRTRRSR